MRTDALDAIPNTLELAKMPFEPMLQLQRGLGLLGYPIGSLDGLYGPRSRSAWAEFEMSCGMPADGHVSRAGIDQLCEDVATLEILGPHDMTTRDGAVRAIIAACERHDLGHPAQIAYILATVQHETNDTFMPVREAYYLGAKLGEAHRQALRYYPYYGRGYVQLTWKRNYEFYGALLERDLVNRPDLALEPAISLFVLVHGFKTGAFTGRSLTSYVGEDRQDFFNARRCINILDKADHIAELAEDYLRHLDSMMAA